MRSGECGCPAVSGGPLARAITDQGVPVHPDFLTSLSDGRRIHPGLTLAAALAHTLGVPESYSTAGRSGSAPTPPPATT